MSDNRRICLVTTGHPSTNPRLVKEADALAEAGHEVRVVACKFVEWADKADRLFEGRPWRVEWVRFGAMAPRHVSILQRLRRKLSQQLVRHASMSDALVVRGIHYVVPELARAAASERADLFIAHNLAALPAAYRAAQRYGARLGFDAEDYHRGEFADGIDSVMRRLVVRVEESYIPKCDYVTAASDGIAEAYASRLRIERPTTILNVFPLAERDVTLSDEERKEEKPDGMFSLYWFSQTIGPGRGLEDIICALPQLPDHVILSLRGQWATEYDSQLLQLASRVGVRSRIRVLGVTPPLEMTSRASVHDIGLAIEPGRSDNNRLAVSNKIFTYALAGIPVLATNTPGHLSVAADFGMGIMTYVPGDVPAAVRGLNQLRQCHAARDEARRIGETRFNWDIEKRHFLEVIDNVLES